MIYLIIEVNFDELENRDNIQRRIIGYCDDKESAIRYIEKLKSETATFVPRYEKVVYPYFEYKAIRKIE